VDNTLRALIVGIDEYELAHQQKIPGLRCARNDALEIARMLRTSTTLHLPTANLHLLTNEQATKRAIERAKDDCFFPHHSDQKTISLFYFAGHGIVKNDLVYLCSHNMDFYYPEERGILLNHVYDWLHNSKAECSIAIIDACFSGGVMTNTSHHVSVAERAKKATAFPLRSGPTA
jgi:uncharacterized caspase-like protein